MDKTCCIWEVSENFVGPCLWAKYFQGAVRYLDWRSDSNLLATSGFERSVRLVDVSSGSCVSKFTTPEYVTCVKFHPVQDHLLVGGMFSSGLFCWDTRANQLVRQFKSDLGLIHDVLFPNPTLPTQKQQILSCPDVTKRSAVDKAILAWDLESGAPMFYQIYHEAFTCTALRRHPLSSHVCAQSSAGYIIIVDSEPPYKLNKRKRFEGHSVGASRIGFDFSCNGQSVVSGSSTGECVAYDWKTTKIRWRFQAHTSAACVEVACHPKEPSRVVTAGSDGRVSLWETESTKTGRIFRDKT